MKKEAKKIVWQEVGDLKKVYYDMGRVSILERLLDRMLDGLYKEGYLNNEVDVSVCFKGTEDRGEILEMNFKVLE